MGKRQRRYRAAELAQQAAVLVGREADLITRQGTAWHGRITAVGPASIEWVDLRQHRKVLPISELEEVVIDWPHPH
jgi:hypothetical protein